MGFISLVPDACLCMLTPHFAAWQVHVVAWSTLGDFGCRSGAGGQVLQTSAVVGVLVLHDRGRGLALPCMMHQVDLV